MKTLTKLAALMATLATFSGCDWELKSRRAPENDRDNLRFRNAMAAYQAGRLDEAIKGFEGVIAASPLNATARFQLASLQHDYRKDYLAAIANYRIYAELAPKSDKCDIAVERARLCEEQYKTKVEYDIRTSENSGMVAELNALKDKVAELEDEKQELAGRIAAMDKSAKDLRQENERVRRLVGSIGEGESTERVSLDVKSLLDEEEDDTDRIRFSADVAQLMRDEVEESAETPLAVTPKEPHQPAAEKPEAKPQPTPNELYVVKEGDTLYKLAKERYGNVGDWKKIREANKEKIAPDGRIRAGQEIVLP